MKTATITTLKRRPKLLKGDTPLELFDQLVGVLLEEDDWRDIAHDAGVDISTLYRWSLYKTKNPQLRTLYGVAFALGYDLAFIRR